MLQGGQFNHAPVVPAFPPEGHFIRRVRRSNAISGPFLSALLPPAGIGLPEFVTRHRFRNASPESAQPGSCVNPQSSGVLGIGSRAPEPVALLGNGEPPVGNTVAGMAESFLPDRTCRTFEALGMDSEATPARSAEAAYAGLPEGISAKAARFAKRHGLWGLTILLTRSIRSSLRSGDTVKLDLAVDPEVDGWFTLAFTIHTRAAPEAVLDLDDRLHDIVSDSIPVKHLSYFAVRFEFV